MSNVYYAFVDIIKKELILDADGSYAYWLTKESAIDVVKKVHKDAPQLDISRYGIALITKTQTEFSEGNTLEFTNIEVECTFLQVLERR